MDTLRLCLCSTLPLLCSLAGWPGAEAESASTVAEGILNITTKGLWRSRSYFHDGLMEIAGKVLTNSSARRKSNWHSNFQSLTTIEGCWWSWTQTSSAAVANWNDLMHRKAIKPRCGIMGVPILTLSKFMSSVRDKGTAPFGASPEAFGSPPEEQDMHTCLYFGWQLQRRQHLQAAFVCIYFLILCCRSVWEQSSVLSQLTQ